MGATGPRRRGHLSLVPDLTEAGESDDVGQHDGAELHDDIGQTFGTAESRRGQQRLAHARYTLRIAREETPAGCWRRMLVQEDLGLDALHAMVCVVHGWDPDGDGRHVFVSPAGTVSAVHSDQLCLEDVLQASGESIVCESVLRETGRNVVRRAVITVERVEEAEWTPEPDPVLIDGREAGEEIDIAAGNARLRGLGGMREFEPVAGSAFAAVLERLPEARAPRFYWMLARMAADAGAAPSSLAGADPAKGAERAIMHLQWLLRKVGPTTVDADGVRSGGIDLDLRGQMPKPIVSKARKEICSPDRYRPRSLLELKNPEIVAVRKAAEDFGLTWMREWPTKDKLLLELVELSGRPAPVERRLERTELGDALAEDGAALLRHVVATLPFGDTDLERDDVLLWLAVLAAGGSPSRQRVILAEAMAALGPDHEARARWVEASRNQGFMFAIDALDSGEVGVDGRSGKWWVRAFVGLVLAQPESVTPPAGP